MTDEVDCCVIGAGVVGLAIGAALAPAGRSLVIVERAASFGQGISSRNSEVIHAGIYYENGSAKARFCVAGREQLYDYCARRRVPHRRIGKLIVATSSEEEEELETLLGKAHENGVGDLEYWSRTRMAREEPAVRATLALYSPSTGILSAHGLMSALLQEAESAGALFTPFTEVTGVVPEGDRFLVQTRLQGRETYAFYTRILINSAGLGAQAVAGGIEGLDQATIPPLYLCKGDYFALGGGAASPFRHLIYPVPDRSGQGLGVHATLDLAGSVRFGPDVAYVADEDYAVAPDKAVEYYEAIRRYFPSLEAARLMPAYAGIRPKLMPEGGGVQDFVIQSADDHGMPGLVQLFGIESPGLTASLAIASEVKRLLEDLL